jgi:hypothetical protein
MRRRIRDLQLANQRPDSAEEVVERRLRRAAGEQAVKERQEKFPVLTAENADEAIRFQEARIQALMKRGRQ